MIDNNLFEVPAAWALFELTMNPEGHLPKGCLVSKQRNHEMADLIVLILTLLLP